MTGRRPRDKQLEKIKEENEISNQPRIVRSHDIRIDGDYAEWIADLKHRYRSAQVKASIRLNAEKLLFNWELGRDLAQKNSANGKKTMKAYLWYICGQAYDQEHPQG